MRRMVGLVLGVILLAGCGGSGHGASGNAPLVIHARLMIAAAPGSEPIATGTVLQGSSLGGSPFCVEGKILDSHADRHPGMSRYGLIARTITCPQGTLTIGLTPKVGPQGPTGKGTWTIVSGTGAYKTLHGNGKEKIVYDPEHEAIGRETLTATVTR